MACGLLYKDAIVITTVEKIGVGADAQFRLALPFQVFGLDVVRNGSLVTYSLDKLEGQEVMAKVDYKVEDEKEVKKFAGYLGNPKAAVKYATHYPVTLSDSKATYDADGVKIPYDGVDKNEKADFCEALTFKSANKIDEIGAIDK